MASTIDRAHPWGEFLERVLIPVTARESAGVASEGPLAKAAGAPESGAGE